MTASIPQISKWVQRSCCIRPLLQKGNYMQPNRYRKRPLQIGMAPSNINSLGGAIDKTQHTHSRDNWQVLKLSKLHGVSFHQARLICELQNYRGIAA